MPRGKLARGQNSTEIMSSGKSNSAAVFLRIQTDIHVYIHMTCKHIIHEHTFIFTSC